MALVIVSLVSNLLMLTGPLFMLQVYDRVLASRSVPTLIVLTALIAALFALYAFLDALRSRMAARYANVMDAGISERLFAAAVQFKLIANAPKTADPLRDGDTVRQFLASPAPLTLLDLPWVPVYLAVVFLFHYWLGWLAVAGCLIITVLMIANEAFARKPSQEANSEQFLRQRQTDDIRLNAESVVAMGMLVDLRARWRGQTEKMLSAQRSGGDRAAFFFRSHQGSPLFSPVGRARFGRLFGNSGANDTGTNDRCIGCDCKGTRTSGANCRTVAQLRQCAAGLGESTKNSLGQSGHAA
ncbi:hypothetical protein [Devosia sp.]|uniref:hypothetical protein n=1 Tax=Devosia sp. TaxID=1871048 RepID=UPI0027342B24|nr:hypothetical protein [Devosia sp.]MDP2781875.1 hypothetical protein [Devosia sp.]